MKSNIKAPTVTAILHIHVLLITIKGIVALNKNTKTCTPKVIKVRFINFSNHICLRLAIQILSIYFVPAFICHIMFLINQYIAKILHEKVVYAYIIAKIRKTTLCSS